MNAVSSAGANVSGVYVSYWSNASLLPGCTSPCSSSQGFLKYCYSPCSTFLPNGATYYVAVADYGGEAFIRWSDGTADRFYRLVVGNTSAVVVLTAVYLP